MAWEENSHICLHMQLIAILSRIEVEYDKTAFQVEYNCEYVYSKEDWDMLDGADDSTVTYELTPLKKGLFDIYEVEGFRCQETARKKHTIVVI